jgi:hypothetical protein
MDYLKRNYEAINVDGGEYGDENEGLSVAYFVKRFPSTHDPVPYFDAMCDIMGQSLEFPIVKEAPVTREAANAAYSNSYKRKSPFQVAVMSVLEDVRAQVGAQRTHIATALSRFFGGSISNAKVTLTKRGTRLRNQDARTGRWPRKAPLSVVSQSVVPERPLKRARVATEKEILVETEHYDPLCYEAVCASIKPSF